MHRFVLFSQGFVLTSVGVFVFMRRYHKDTVPQDSIENEMEQTPMFQLIANKTGNAFFKTLGRISEKFAPADDEE